MQWLLLDPPGNGGYIPTGYGSNQSSAVIISSSKPRAISSTRCFARQVYWYCAETEVREERPYEESQRLFQGKTNQYSQGTVLVLKIAVVGSTKLIRHQKCQGARLPRSACYHCVRLSLNCEYPAVPYVTHQVGNSYYGLLKREITDQEPTATSPNIEYHYSACKTCASSKHFLLHSFPHHALGNDVIWTDEVPFLSHRVRCNPCPSS